MSREANNVHPEILDGLEFESQFIQKTSGAQRRDVKLNRGDAWLVRFLPAKLGPDKHFYARIAKHWLNMKAIVCPRHTEPAFGGDPNAYCSVCDLAEVLNGSSKEEVSKFGFKLRGNANWITYCAVFEKSSNGGNPVAMSEPDIMQPYVFQHYRSSWEELCGFIRSGARRCADSVLDVEKGNDFYLNRGPKGIRLDKQDAAPLFDLKDLGVFDEKVAKIMALCKDPVVKMPTDKSMDDFVAKAEAEGDKLAHDAARSSTRRGAAPERTAGGDDDDIPYDDDPAPRRGARQEAEPAQEATRSRRAPAEPEPEPAPVQTRRAAAPAAAAPAATMARRAAAPAETEAPAQTRRTVATAAPAATTARRAAVPQPEQAPDPEQQDGEQEQAAGEGEQEQAQAPDPEPEPAAPRRSPEPTARPSSRGVTPTRTAATTTSAPRRTVAAAAPSRSSAPTQESLDPDENIPEESTDQAPPLIAGADDLGAAEAPPEVGRRGASLGDRIGSKIAGVQNTTRK